MRLFFLLFLLSAFLPIVAASIHYEVNQIIVDNAVSITELNITPETEYFVYEVAPTDHRVIIATLKGSHDFVPRLELWNPRTEETIIRVEKSKGEVASLNYASGVYKGEPEKYYIIVDAFKDEGQTFTLTFQARLQNDAGLGDDATDFIRKGALIESGSYEGFLGDGDNADYYNLFIGEGETLYVNLTPKDNVSLRLTITDSNFVTKIDRKNHLEGETVSERYTSPRDQELTIGIMGGSPYYLDLFIPGRTVIKPVENNDSDEVAPNTSEKEVKTTNPEEERLPMDDRPVMIKVPRPDLENDPEKSVVAPDDEGCENSDYLDYFLVAVIIVLLAIIVLGYLRRRHG